MWRAGEGVARLRWGRAGHRCRATAVGPGAAGAEGGGRPAGGRTVLWRGFEMEGGRAGPAPWQHSRRADGPEKGRPAGVTRPGWTCGGRACGVQRARRSPQVQVAGCLHHRPEAAGPEPCAADGYVGPDSDPPAGQGRRRLGAAACHGGSAVRGARACLAAAAASS